MKSPSPRSTNNLSVCSSSCLSFSVLSKFVFLRLFPNIFGKIELCWTCLVHSPAILSSKVKRFRKNKLRLQLRKTWIGRNEQEDHTPRFALVSLLIIWTTISMTCNAISFKSRPIVEFCTFESNPFYNLHCPRQCLVLKILELILINILVLIPEIKQILVCLMFFLNFVFDNGLYDWQPHCTTSLSRHKYQVMCYMVNRQMSRMHLELRWSGT